MKNLALNIRPENEKDIPAIYQVNEKAFNRPNEARLVDLLRQNNAFIASLVATTGGHVVGHILFTPVTITAAASEVSAAGLGPLAVLPPYQNLGIGSRLVEAGLVTCRQAGFEVAVVLGHSRYYPRFGFAKAVDFDIRLAMPVPEEAFMVAALQSGGLAGVHGVARYRSEFDGV